MRKLRRLRDRLGYGPGHFSQLATSHDYFGDGWGQLHELDDGELRDAVEDMQLCWRQHHAEIREECEPLEPWFTEYFTDPQRLIAETTKARSYMEYQHKHNGYRPYDEFEKQYNPPAPAAPPAAD